MYTVILGDKVIELPQEALDSIDALFRALDNNPTVNADWETMTLVSNTPPAYPWDMGDRLATDYELKEGKHENEQRTDGSGQGATPSENRQAKN